MRSDTPWTILCSLPIHSRLGDPELEEEGKKETFKMASCFLTVFRVDRKPHEKGWVELTVGRQSHRQHLMGGAYTRQIEPQAASHGWSVN